MEDNIIMDLKQMGINTWNWVDLAQDSDYLRSLVNVTLNLRVSYAMELVNHLNLSRLNSSSGYFPYHHTLLQKII